MYNYVLLLLEPPIPGSGTCQGLKESHCCPGTYAVCTKYLAVRAI